jgi:hypothetical protein
MSFSSSPWAASLAAISSCGHGGSHSPPEGARARLRGRERNATAIPQPLSQRLGQVGHVAVVILTLMIVVIAGATCPFVTLAILYLIGLAMPR